jgi:hypothetical protein
MLAVRPLGIVLVVVGPSVVNLTAGLNIKVNPLAVTVTVQKNVSNAILNYINSLTLGEGLNLNKLIQLAFEADPNVVDVQIGSALINSSAQNISATGFQLLRSVLTSITVGLF